MSGHHIRIIPPASEGGPMATHGTRVETADGAPIAGVTKVELVAEVGGLWRAVVHVHAEVPQIEAIAEIVQAATPSAALELLAELRGYRADLQANTEATRAHTEAIQGMAAILAADLEDDTDAAGDGDAPPPLPTYMDGTPRG